MCVRPSAVSKSLSSRQNKMPLILTQLGVEDVPYRTPFYAMLVTIFHEIPAFANNHVIGTVCT